MYHLQRRVHEFLAGHGFEGAEDGEDAPCDAQERDGDARRDHRRKDEGEDDGEKGDDERADLHIEGLLRVAGDKVVIAPNHFYQEGQYLSFLPGVLRLLKCGGILITDNVLQEGDVMESRYAVCRRDRTIHGRMRDYLYTLMHHEELVSTILSGGDGMALSYKR